MDLDAHCLKIISDWRKGKITQEEAEIKIQKHGDELITEMLNNAFSTNYTK